MTQQATQSLVGTQVCPSPKRGAAGFSCLLYTATDMTRDSFNPGGISKQGGMQMGIGSVTKRVSVACVLPTPRTEINGRKGTRTYTASVVRSL